MKSRMRKNRTYGSVRGSDIPSQVEILERSVELSTRLINKLNRKVEENIKDNAVVISIGYSVLNQEDQQLSDVFERADRMMYERKKELKSMGAPTNRQ